jgi:cytochrome c peroxidase
MPSLRCACLLLLALLPLACQPAHRYPAPERLQPPKKDESEAETLNPIWSWIEVKPRPDVPIRFIHESSPEWARLPKFWNHVPPTASLGLPPLQAGAALVLAEPLEVVKIKLPRGLPELEALLPAANPPTVLRWQLGKKIFAAPLLKAGADILACATCHQPGHGFTQDRLHPLGGVFNTLGLLNVAYNRHQFWDGRAVSLEETIVRSLADEQPDKEANPARSHRWGGLVKELSTDKQYREQFYRVFGVEQPTQDTIAKALATYLRTILTGDSLYDRAEGERVRTKAAALTTAHFLPFLDDKALAGLDAEKLKKEEVARQLARGAELFFGKARCAVCHNGPLFTDHDFHNIGLSEDNLPPPGQETGRFAQMPIGLKEARLIGAFRTPTLRGLPRTEPYFHDGKRRTLRQVVDFFNLHVDYDNPYLAPMLHDAGQEGRLNLDVEDSDALVLFLMSLDGMPVDPVVVSATK